MKTPRNNPVAKKLLYVDHGVPRFDEFAGSRTSFLYMELLVRMGLDVTFLAGDFERPEPWTNELEQLGVTILGHDWEQWLEINGGALDYAFFNKPEPAEQFLPAVRRLTRAAVIYQCHDLHHLRVKGKAGLHGGQAELGRDVLEEEALEEAARWEVLERFAITASDVVLTFSDSEASLIREQFDGAEVMSLPLYFYASDPPLAPNFDSRSGLVFVGSCAHEPNHDAITWFCSEVLPLIRIKQPDIRLEIIGANPPEDVISLQSDSVNIAGKLSDDELLEYYARARLMIVPLRFGAGVKGKVVEALWQGLPLVSTAIGLEGLPGIEEVAMPYDNAADFAAEVIALYRNPERLGAMSRQGQDYAAGQFSRARAEELLETVLERSAIVSGERTAQKDHTKDYGASKLIAFHLPQYHAISENNEWWGEGFTDWHNVRKAEPLFDGHHQPHEPLDSNELHNSNDLGQLGYYDMADPDVLSAQAALAREFGIHGFCYYHYWFNGKQLLEGPVETMLASGKPDFPFCLCWANENWTRRWDGESQQVLIEQSYSDDDDRNHIRSLFPFFRDSRYIQVDGKPLLLVYRTGELPNPSRTAAIWREEAQRAGIGDLFLCRVEGLDSGDPREIGFDAAVEFAPNWSLTGPEPDSETLVQLAGAQVPAKQVREHHFHSYPRLADAMMAEEAPDWPWFRSVMPSWDNTARRKSGANVFLGATPERYQAWLSQALDDTRMRAPDTQQLVFINAWNEWAEGCHLEPDVRHGRGYLEATRTALDAATQTNSEAAVHGNRQAEADRYRVEVLERQLAERNRAIEEMQRSTSWRITHPVRWLKTKWRALRHAARRN